jgi:hypothetical protein
MGYLTYIRRLSVVNGPSPAAPGGLGSGFQPSAISYQSSDASPLTPYSFRLPNQLNQFNPSNPSFASTLQPRSARRQLTAGTRLAPEAGGSPRHGASGATTFFPTEQEPPEL